MQRPYEVPALCKDSNSFTLKLWITPRNKSMYEMSRRKWIRRELSPNPRRLWHS